jgi:hypothetical protein
MLSRVLKGTRRTVMPTPKQYLVLDKYSRTFVSTDNIADVPHSAKFVVLVLLTYAFDELEEIE